MNKQRGSSKEEKPKPSPRQLYVFRHGERMDFVFGRVWVEECFDSKGRGYLRNEFHFSDVLGAINHSGSHAK